MKLIDKDKVVAEIERIEHETNYEPFTDEVLGKRCTCRSLLSFIDTLEIKEVDFDKEIETHLKDCLDVKFPTTDIELIKKDVTYTAKKFFELGLKVSNKGE